MLRTVGLLKRLSTVSTKARINNQLGWRRLLSTNVESTDNLNGQQDQPPPLQSILRRALLYVPGNDQRKIDKVTKLADVDSIVFDCEDGVAANKKVFFSCFHYCRSLSVCFSGVF